MNGECRLCGRRGFMHTHHVFGGSYRKLSDYYGATVTLCPECHRYIHSAQGVEDKEQLQFEVQTELMDAYDWTIRDWLNIWNKSWL